MKKLVTFYLLIIAVSVAQLQSCSQCNKAHDNVRATVDTLSNPQLTAINAEIKKDSLNPYLYFKRAKIYEAGNDVKSATTDMFLALTLDSLRPEFYTYAADLFKKTGEPQKGIALMDKAIATDSLYVPYYVKASELAYIDTTIKGNYQLALSYLNAAIARNPQNADIYFFKGNVFKSLGDTNRAISSFQTATELNPKFYNAYVQLGLLLDKKKDKNAEKYLDNAIKVSDRPEDALYAKANILMGQGITLADNNQNARATDKFNTAIENFKKVIEVNHNNVEAYMGAAFSYYQMDSVEQAYKFYNLATQISPSYAGAYYSKGLCAEDLGRTKEAIGLFETCLNLDPKFTKAAEHLKKLKVQ